MRVRDLKGGAMFLFARIKGYLSRKAKTASPACRKIPSGILPEGKAKSPVKYLENLLLSRFFYFRGSRQTALPA